MQGLLVLTKLPEFETTVEQQNPYDFQMWWVIIAGILLGVAIISLIIFHILLRKKLKIHEAPKVRTPRAGSIIHIKRKYDSKLAKLEDKYRQNKISSRKAYQSLSVLTRDFVYEMTKIRVQQFTLLEIAELGIPVLTLLVSEYYEPEFSEISEGDFITTISNARAAIAGWR